MLKQVFRTQTSKQWGVRSRRAAVQIAILICAGLLAGCVNSDQIAHDGSPGRYAFQSNPDLGSNTPGSHSTASGGTQRDARALAVPSPTSATGNAGYLVGALDVLDISVFKVPELSKSVQVADTGTINLPLLGEVPAAGKTASEIEKDITRQLGVKYLKSPQVTVYVKEYNSQRVTIEGAVHRPGVYPIRGTLSLLRLVATAEGLDKDLYSKDITVFRTVNGGRTAQVYDIDAIREGKADDPPLQQGDVVVVDTSAAKSALQNTLKIVPAAAALRPTAW